MTVIEVAARGLGRARRLFRTPSTLVFLGAWAALFVIASAWVVASPLSSGPDESGHVAKAAGVVRGQFDGAPTSRSGITTFRLPADVGDVGGPMTCFAGNPNRWAACAPSPDGFTSSPRVVESGVGSYDPLYYAVVGWPSLVLHGAHSFFAMRAMSALLSTFLLAIVFWVAARSDRARWLVTGTAIAMTPMVLYLGSCGQASGLEISGTAAVTALGWSLLHGRERPAVAEAVLLAVAVVLTASARTTSPLFVVVVLVALCCTVPFARLRAVVRTRAVWLAACGGCGPGGPGPRVDPGRRGARRVHPLVRPHETRHPRRGVALALDPR